MVTTLDMKMEGWQPAGKLGDSYYCYIMYAVEKWILKWSGKKGFQGALCFGFPKFVFGF